MKGARRQCIPLAVPVAMLWMLVVLLTGCSTPLAPVSGGSPSGASASLPQGVPAPADTAAEPWVYTVPLDDEQIFSAVVDQDGTEILRGDYLSILYDTLTGRPQAIAQRIPLTRAPSGTRQDLVIFDDCDSILYSLEGEVLRQRGPGVFMAGFGGYVVHADREIPSYDFSPKEVPTNFSSALVDMQTGETVLEDAYSLSAFSNGRLMVMNAGYRVMGFVDEGLNKLAGFPMERDYYGMFEWGSLYIADAVAEGYTSTGYVLDENFTSLSSYPGQTLTQHDGIGDGYLLLTLWNEDAETTYQIVDGKTGQLVLDLAGLGYANYYDGERMITGYRDSEGGFKYALNDAAGRTLADGFDDLRPVGPLFALYAEGFYGHRYGTLMLVDRDDNVTTQVNNGCSNIYNYGPGNPFSTAQWRFVVERGERDSQGKADSAVYDAVLNEIVPFGRYNGFYPASTHWGARQSGYARYLAASRVGDVGKNNLQRQDILDLDGKLVVERLDWVYTYLSYGNRFVVEKDGAIGLIDTTGAWLWKTEK